MTSITRNTFLLNYGLVYDKVIIILLLIRLKGFKGQVIMFFSTLLHVYFGVEIFFFLFFNG
ncbi:hypothetical protein D3C86_1492780 [compost metagenome]